MPETEHSPEKPVPLYTTATDIVDHPAFRPQTARIEGRSVSPGLRPISGSLAQPTSKGEAVDHVFGPQQSAVDPHAAGLQVDHDPVTRNDSRVITHADGAMELSGTAPGPSGAPSAAAAPAAPKSETPKA